MRYPLLFAKNVAAVFFRIVRNYDNCSTLARRSVFRQRELGQILESGDEQQSLPDRRRIDEYGSQADSARLYEDTDFSGLVYHARYLHFLERGRTDYLRCLGVGQRELLNADEEGLVFVVHRMEIDFKGPARMDDVLTIHTVTDKAGGAKMVLSQEIRCDGALLISAKVIVAVINAKGRPRRLPEELAHQLLAASAGQAG